MKSMVEKQTNKQKTQAKAPILHKTNLHLTHLGPYLPSVQRRKDKHPHIHTLNTVVPAEFLFYCSHNALHVAGIPENLRDALNFLMLSKCTIVTSVKEILVMEALGSIRSSSLYRLWEVIFLSWWQSWHRNWTLAFHSGTGTTASGTSNDRGGRWIRGFI